MAVAPTAAATTAIRRPTATAAATATAATAAAARAATAIGAHNGVQRVCRCAGKNALPCLLLRAHAVNDALRQCVWPAVG